MSQNRALFDIKPVDDSGSLDVERISAVQPVVNLAVARRRAATRRPAPRTQTKRTALSPKLELPPDPMNNRGVREEFESALNENTDLHLELAKFGVAHRLARLPDGQVGQPRPERLKYRRWWRWLNRCRAEANSRLSKAGLSWPRRREHPLSQNEGQKQRAAG